MAGDSRRCPSSDVLHLMSGTLDMTYVNGERHQEKIRASGDKSKAVCTSRRR